MKRKNLNTVVKHVFENGEGIPFKEAYWNKMNELLDEHLPVQLASSQSFSLKHHLLEIVVFTVLVSGQILGSITTNIGTPIIVTSSPEIALSPSPGNASERLLSAHEPQQSLATTRVNNDVQQASSSDNQTIKNAPIHNIETAFPIPSEETENKKRILRPKSPFAANEKASTETFTLTDKFNLQTKKTISSVEDKSALVTTKEQVREMIELSSAKHLPLDRFTYDLAVANPQMLNYPHRNSFIQHITILPYLSLTHSGENLVYKEANTRYSKPAQNTLGAGISLELIFKNIALRTGVGYSTLQVNQLTETTKNIYSYDTSYTIINPVYQTTPSGNPVALIKQQIDSSYQSAVTRRNENQLQYQYLSIPLTFQYFIAHKKWQWMAEAGMINNFVINRQPTLANSTENAPSKLPLSPYFAQVTLGSGIRYSIHSKFFVGAQYNFIRSADIQKRSLLQNGHVLGIGAGYYIR